MGEGGRRIAPRGRGARTGRTGWDPRLSPGLPVWPEPGAGLQGSSGTCHLERRQLATVLAESTEPWLHSRARGGVRPLLPRPSRGSRSQTGPLKTQELGFIGLGQLRVQAEFAPGQKSHHLNSRCCGGLPLWGPSPRPCTRDVTPSRSLVSTPSPAGRCGAEPRARWPTPRRRTPRTAGSPGCLCW